MVDMHAIILRCNFLSRHIVLGSKYATGLETLFSSKFASPFLNSNRHFFNQNIGFRSLRNYIWSYFQVPSILKNMCKMSCNLLGKLGTVILHNCFILHHTTWFGSMLCGTACDSTDSREISNDGNPSHPHLFTSFQHSSLDGAQEGPIKPLITWPNIGLVIRGEVKKHTTQGHLMSSKLCTNGPQVL